MSKSRAKRIKACHLPLLAAMTLVFLAMDTNTRLDAAPVLMHEVALPQPHNSSQIVPSGNFYVLENSQIHVLSSKDAALYRAAFNAQEKGDWATADAALAELKDKRLLGHVLADRYLRSTINASQIQQWMASYADLPEALPLYDQARHLRGFSALNIPHPSIVASWTGNNNELSVSSGFRDQGESTAHHKNRIASKINAALRHGDPLKARELLTTELQRGTLDVSESSEMTSHIASAFYYQGEIERARTLAHLAAASGNPLGLWIDGLSAWKQSDFVSSTRSFASLAQAPNLSSWDRSAAAFWAYRASKHTGDEAQARHWLAESAKYPRSFYGTMAASLTGHGLSRSWKMPELSAQSVNSLSQQPAGWQALALVQIGHNDLAESELRRLNPVARHDLQNAALALAEKAHMPSLTLQLAGVATNENGQPFDGALYPVPPWQPSSGFKVDRALIYALMRHESQFDPEAVSGRGACGLMQIMPSTARDLANDNSPGRDCPDRLFDPATNMDLGQKYVRVLAGQPMIGDNLLLLLAAYNGGPGNLARWISSEDLADPLLFIESLPMRETHDYVQQVLMQYWVYKARMSQPDTAVTQLAHGQWPRYALGGNGIRHAANDTVEIASLAAAH